MANEIRLRANNIQGTITDNPLTNVATTINSAGFIDLPTVTASNHLMLILDPLEANGAAEIVIVTAHTAASPTVTVARAQESSTARQHSFGTTWFHGPTVADWNYTDRLALSSNRPASPFSGQVIYETDTDTLTARSAAGGGAWQSAVPLGAWTTWVPTLTNLTLGSGTSVAAYAKIGRTVTWRWAFTLGAGSAVGTDPSITLPFAPNAGYPADHVLGQVALCDVGVAVYEGFVTYVSASTVRFWAMNSAGTYVTRNSITAAVPFAWGATDQLLAIGTYEAVS